LFQNDKDFSKNFMYHYKKIMIYFKKNICNKSDIVAELSNISIDYFDFMKKIKEILPIGKMVLFQHMMIKYVIDTYFKKTHKQKKNISL
jgi:hypothetical protein